jgi:hypothetical protein
MVEIRDLTFSGFDPQQRDTCANSLHSSLSLRRRLVLHWLDQMVHAHRSGHYHMPLHESLSIHVPCVASLTSRSSGMGGCDVKLILPDGYGMCLSVRLVVTVPSRIKKIIVLAFTSKVGAYVSSP